MSVQLNHTIVWCRDQERSATFLADVLGLAAPARVGPFHVVTLANGVSLDFHAQDGAIARQHYAFLMTAAELDAAHTRIRERGLDWWADPGRMRAHELYQHDGGRGLYFRDPDGHLLEIMTRPTVGA